MTAHPKPVVVRDPEWLQGKCACGCGGDTPLSTRTYLKRGVRKGEPTRCIPGHQITPSRASGSASATWKGGRYIGSNGYVFVFAPDHPRACGGYVMEHILVASNALGKPIPVTAPVHHINEDKTDNRPENLVVCQDTAYHMLLHRRMRAKRLSGHADWVKCNYCPTPPSRNTTSLARRRIAARAGGCVPSHPKPKVVKDAEYLAAVRQMPCHFAPLGNCNHWTTFGKGKSEVSHLDGKSRDDHTLPSCGGHHRTNLYAWHSGWRSFCQRYGFSKDELIAEAERLYALYKEGQ